MTLPPEAERVLADGTLCYLAASTPRGPHLTPVVFAFDRGRLWATTARRTVKARAWRRDPRAAGLVRHADRAVAFRGRVEVYDVLDPNTWEAGLRRAPALLRATARFSLKNARYFAGYARDARRIPLAWTPPGRVLVAIEPEDVALLDGGRVVESHGKWAARATGRRGFEVGGVAALPEPPDDVEMPAEGEGVVALESARGNTVVPVRWRRRDAEGTYYLAASRAALALAGARAAQRASLVVDRSSAWRAAQMRGAMLRGEAELFLPTARGWDDAVTSAGIGEPETLLRLRPSGLVWWSGWTSGTVGRP